MTSYNNFTDNDGNPAGGKVKGVGIDIIWQNGPMSVDGERQQQNGAFVEDVIKAAVQRIQYYQSTQFACEENKDAIHSLQNALAHLGQRTQRRTEEGVEGTYQGN